MKKVCAWIMVAVLLLTAGCSSKKPEWQEQYDLGVRYLSEGNYEEAILAFSAAIEIDAKQVDAYLLRGDAYIAAAKELASQSGKDNEEKIADYLDKAKQDYERAAELDPDRAGEIDDKLDKWDKAVEELDSFVRSDTLTEEDAYQLYKDYFYTHFSSDDLVYLADVTGDGASEMLVVHFADESGAVIEGHVYTAANGSITEIYSNMGSNFHAGGFYSWYLIPVPGEEGYHLGEETFGMWQGMGQVSFDEYVLTIDGYRVSVSYLELNSEAEGMHDENGVVTDEAWNSYVSKLSSILSGSYCIYAAASNGSGSQPLATSPDIVFGR